MLEFTKKEACYCWGDTVQGRLHIKLSDGSIEITSLRILFHGYGKVNCKGKKDEALQENMTYMKKFSHVISQPFVVSQQEYSFPIEETLPDQLPTSVYSSKGHIQYSIQCTMEYKTSYGTPSVVKAVRGITVVESLDLNKISKTWFETRNEFEQRKFGWFACTGGHIRLHLSIERSAFVCGEAISFIGKIENKSDRRIEKVSVCLIRNTRFGNDVEEDVENTTVDNQLIQEDLMAMYIEEGCTNKIDKKVHIPCTAPSTPLPILFRSGQLDGNKFQLRRKSQLGRLSLTSQKSRPSISSSSNIQRILAITYKFEIKVRSGGIDVIELSVPVVIGTIPMIDHVNSGELNDPLDKSVFNLCRQDKPIPLLDDREKTLCNKAQLQHVNKYPFYATLPTSSKQSKKLCVVAQTIKTENRIMQTIKSAVDEENY
uniref:Arrestin_C domain-containing protein n=1 Tax=Caenorhabditis japonica TaxID=281687 RepID=A0A8R1DSU8_CAEJA